MHSAEDRRAWGGGSQVTCQASTAGGLGNGRMPTCLKMTWGTMKLVKLVCHAPHPPFEQCPPWPHTLFPAHLPDVHSHGAWLSVSIYQSAKLMRLSLTQCCLLRCFLLTNTLLASRESSSSGRRPVAGLILSRVLPPHDGTLYFSLHPLVR